MMRAEIAQAKTLVIKVGSSLLVRDNQLDRQWLTGLAQDVQEACTRGQRVVMVSSGAVALGCAALDLVHNDLEHSNLTLEQSQAAAAAGQIELAHGWQEVLAPRGLTAAQILLTIEDTEQRRRYLNARQTVQQLLKLGAVPVINENDTVATQELRYGDNDRLAARVASMISADCLILFSDVDGFYTARPTSPEDPAQGQSNDTAEFIAEVEKIDETLMAMAGGTGSTYGSGGMVTKLQAAQIATAAGCHMVLADGRALRPLQALEDGARCSLFRAHDTPRTARKNWIGGSLRPNGRVHVDAGALDALRAGKSLLPIGVTRVEGDFERGDCVGVFGPDGAELGRGLSAYTSTQASRMIGHSSSQIAAKLGYHGRAELVHRDDLVIFNKIPAS